MWAKQEGFFIEMPKPWSIFFAMHIYGILFGLNHDCLIADWIFCSGGEIQFHHNTRHYNDNILSFELILNVNCERIFILCLFVCVMSNNWIYQLFNQRVIIYWNKPVNTSSKWYKIRYNCMADDTFQFHTLCVRCLVRYLFRSCGFFLFCNSSFFIWRLFVKTFGRLQCPI